MVYITTFAFVVFVLALRPDFYKPEKRRIRGTLFLLLGVSTSIPIFHLIFFGDHVTGFGPGPKLYYWEIGGAIYILGGLFYVFRFPEKRYPIKFDLFGHSHNILHIGVLLGFGFHYFGALDSYYYRLNNKCPL